MPTLPACQLPCLLPSTLSLAPPSLQLRLLLCLCTQLCAAFKCSQFTVHYLNSSVFIAMCSLPLTVVVSVSSPLLVSFITVFCLFTHVNSLNWIRWFQLSSFINSTSMWNRPMFQKNLETFKLPCTRANINCIMMANLTESCVWAGMWTPASMFRCLSEERSVALNVPLPFLFDVITEINHHICFLVILSLEFFVFY